MLTQTQHTVESNARELACTFVDGNAVDGISSGEVVQRPEEMLGGNAEHRGADTNAGIQGHNFAVGKLLSHAIYEVDFGPDGPLGTWLGFRNGLEDALGRADLVSSLRYLEAALGMGNHADPGMIAPHFFDVLRLEALVDGAVSLPQNNPSLANCFW